MGGTFGPGMPVQQKPWFHRNWKWLVPVGCLGTIVLFVAFVGGIFFAVETSFRSSDAYSQALTRVQANSQVTARIGQPLRSGWLGSGSINVDGPSGHADLSIPIYGPRGKGTVYVVAGKNAGVWRFETLQVEIAGQPKRIDLLLEEGQPSGEGGVPHSPK